MVEYSDAYLDLLDQGPFDGRVDPWAEEGRYFQQLHSGIIEYTLQQIKRPLSRLGYVAGKETSLQIMQGREPDVFVFQEEPKPFMIWDYDGASEKVQAVLGATIDEEPDLQNIQIFNMENGELVTVIEIVSPRNKTHNIDMIAYIDRRDELLFEKHVNVVEIDLTRSIKRLTQHQLTESYAYHLAVHLPFQKTRVIGIEFDQPLPRYGLPLRGEVVAVEAQEVYWNAYRFASIAAQIRKADHYKEEYLPYSSLLTSQQKQDCLQRVAEWQQTLERLRQN